MGKANQPKKIMQKILIVTQEPNKEASELTHEQLFDIKKNPFLQFLGRLLFGEEINYRKYFNSGNILWMHAKGSECHKPDEDGTKSIREKVLDKHSNLKLIVTFGKHASSVFIEKPLSFEWLFRYIKNGPVSFSEIKQLLNSDISDKIIECKIVCFPHPSGKANKAWMQNAVVCSVNLQQTQKHILKMLNVNNKKQEKTDAGSDNL